MMIGLVSGCVFALLATTAEAGLGGKLGKARRTQKKVEKTQKTVNTVKDVNEALGDVLNLSKGQCKKEGHVWVKDEKKCYENVAEASGTEEKSAEATTEAKETTKEK